MKNEIAKKLLGVTVSLTISIIPVANEKIFATDPYEAKIQRREDFQREKVFLHRRKEGKRFLKKRKLRSPKSLREYDFSSRDYKIIETVKKDTNDKKELVRATKILLEDKPVVDVSEIELRGFTKDTVEYLFAGLKKEDFENIRFKVIVGKGIGSAKGPVLKNFVFGLCKKLGIEANLERFNSGVIVIGSEGKKAEVPAVMKNKYARIKILNDKSKKELQELAKTHDGLEAMLVYANNLIDTDKKRAGAAILEVAMSELDMSKISEYYGARKAIGFAKRFL